MIEKRTIEDRLTDLGQKLPEVPLFADSVMARVHAPQRPALPWSDRLQLWLNQNAAAVTVMLVAVMSVGIAFIFDRNNPRAAAPPLAWYYDTATGLLFTDDATLIPPFLGPSGSPAVRAHLFSCGSCQENDRFVGYYERSNEELRQKLNENPNAAMLYTLWVSGREYSSDVQTWVPATSPQALEITGKLQSKCPPKMLRYCPPRVP